LLNYFIHLIIIQQFFTSTSLFLGQDCFWASQDLLRQRCSQCVASQWKLGSNYWYVCFPILNV
jgi:hypothetical protein